MQYRLHPQTTTYNVSHSSEQQLDRHFFSEIDRILSLLPTVSQPDHHDIFTRYQENLTVLKQTLSAENLRDLRKQIQ
jgi:hypothetical protein